MFLLYNWNNLFFEAMFWYKIHHKSCLWCASKRISCDAFKTTRWSVGTSSSGASDTQSERSPSTQSTRDGEIKHCTERDEVKEKQKDGPREADTKPKHLICIMAILFSISFACKHHQSTVCVRLLSEIPLSALSIYLLLLLLWKRFLKHWDLWESCMFGALGSGPGQVRSSCYPGVKISTEGHRRLGSSPSSSPATNAHTAFQSRASFLSAQNHPHLSISLFRSLSLCFFLTLPLCLHQALIPLSPFSSLTAYGNGCCSASAIRCQGSWEAERVKKKITFTKGGTSAVRCCDHCCLVQHLL